MAARIGEGVHRFVPGLTWTGARLTLGPLRRGGNDPAHRVVDGVLWRCSRSPDGPVSVGLRPGDGGVHASAYGPGAGWLAERLPELLGADQDWTALDLSSVPHLGEVHRAHAGLRLPRTGLVLEALLAAIVEQKVTGLEARASWRVLLHRYGSPAPGPVPATMRVPPTPAELLDIPTWGWHRAGVDHARARAVRAAATVAERLQTFAELTPAEARTKLQMVPGVGEWTAAETTVRALADPDAVSVGDYHVKNWVVHALTGRPRGTDEEMLELLAPWSGQRARVVRLIELSGLRPPRFGPRMTPGLLPSR